MWRVRDGEAVAATACPKLFQVYSVRCSDCLQPAR